MRQGKKGSLPRVRFSGCEMFFVLDEKGVGCPTVEPERKKRKGEWSAARGCGDRSRESARGGGYSPKTWALKM